MAAPLCVFKVGARVTGDGVHSDQSPREAEEAGALGGERQDLGLRSAGEGWRQSPHPFTALVLVSPVFARSLHRGHCDHPCFPYKEPEPWRR